MRILAAMIVTAALATACSHATIPGTTIRDDPDSRAIYNIIVKIRNSLQARDPNALIALVSTQYFEDCGTTDPSDDYGYVELKEKIMSDAMADAKEIFINFQVFDIQVLGDMARADLRYNSRARLDLPSGQLWDTHRDFDRIEFIKENGEWKIVSGM